MESQQALETHKSSMAVVNSIQRKAERLRQDLTPQDLAEIEWHSSRAERALRRYHVLVALN